MKFNINYYFVAGKWTQGDREMCILEVELLTPVRKRI